MANSEPGDSSTAKIPLRGRFLLAAIDLVGCLPLSLARAVGSSFGYISWLIQDRSAKVTLRNLELCFPNMSKAERKYLAKQSLRETGKLATEICVIRKRSHEWLKKRIFKVEGEALLKREIAKGKGLIVLAPHIGNWEVMGQCLPAYGNITILYQPPKQTYLEPVIIASREKTGAVLAPTSRKGIVQLLKSLNGGGITAILPDQNPAKGSGVFSPFFGKPAYSMTLAHGFLRRCDSYVVMGVCKRVRGGFEIYYFDAPPEVYDENLEVSVAAVNRGVEQCVAYCPAQYQWEYKRFRMRPAGAEDVYAFEKNKNKINKK